MSALAPSQGEHVPDGSFRRQRLLNALSEWEEIASLACSIALRCVVVWAALCGVVGTMLVTLGKLPPSTMAAFLGLIAPAGWQTARRVTKP